MLIKFFKSMKKMQMVHIMIQKICSKLLRVVVHSTTSFFLLKIGVKIYLFNEKYMSDFNPIFSMTE